MHSTFDGNVYSVFEILHADKKAGEIYVWALIQEYYKTETDLENGTGMSVPMVLHVEKNGEDLQILGHTLPRDGSYYSGDIKVLFPKSIQSKIISYSSKYIEELMDELEYVVYEKERLSTKN